MIARQTSKVVANANANHSQRGGCGRGTPGLPRRAISMVLLETLCI